MLVENGYLATELGQCPYAPGTEEWRGWQHQFMARQLGRDAVEATERAQVRIAVVRERVMAGRTPANDWHDAVMAEVAPECQISTSWTYQDAVDQYARLVTHLTDQFLTPLAQSFVGLGQQISGVLNQYLWFPDISVKSWDMPPSPRRERRTRGMTIEQRRLEQALSGQPITVRPSSTPIHSKRRGR